MILRLTKRQADAFKLTPSPPRLTKAADGSDWERLFAFHVDHSSPRLPSPVRNYRFAKSLGRRFQADFAWPKEHLLVEVQGGIWRRGGGSHSRPDHIERDIRKQQCAVVLGYRLLPVTPGDVKSGRALELVQTLLRKQSEGEST